VGEAEGAFELENGVWNVQCKEQRGKQSFQTLLVMTEYR
jgi:hypothetical protein